MIVTSFDPAELADTFGIRMASMPMPLPGATDVAGSWGVVEPGCRTHPDNHDENEVLLFVSGTGVVVAADGSRTPVAPGTVAVMEPFDRHVVQNTGDEQLMFTSFYWRDGATSARAAAPRLPRTGDRPVFVFSTPPTPNGDLHLGHLSGPYLGADAYVRFQRMNGVRAWHLTGSDDYQSYVVDRARAEGGTPAETAAHYSAEIAETLRLLDVGVDQYTVTDTAAGYRDGLRDFFSAVLASGVVRARTGPALTDPSTGAYVYEGSVSGGCPGCGGPTSGNICEECGEPNLCVDLREPRTRSGDLPVRAEVTRYTLPLHDFADVVTDHHRHGRVPARLRELARRVFARPTFDLPVSHPADWGVTPAETDVSGQVVWVWPEMAYGFLYGIEALGRREDARNSDGSAWRAAEPAADWKIVHFFGYDNTFYHSLLYPVLYKLAHPGWDPDIDYHVNEFYLLDGAKFSTSRRHAVWGKEILNERSVDAVRYYLSRTRPEGRRTNFGTADYERVVRDRLLDTWQPWLNGLGARVAAGHGGQAPDAGTWTLEHSAFLAVLGTRLAEAGTALGGDGFSLNRAARVLDSIVDDVITFSARESDLADEDSRSRTALALELAAARLLAFAAAPVMPRFAAALAGSLGGVDLGSWPGQVDLLAPGTPVTLADREFFADPAWRPVEAEPVLGGVR